MSEPVTIQPDLAPARSRYADLPDERLVALARDHDALAFETLMRRHNRRLFRLGVSVLRDADAAQDAVQETYLRAFTRLDQYREGHFSAWLARIALNEALMIRRRDARNVPLEDGLLVEADDDAHLQPVADRAAEAAHARHLLEQAVNALPDTFRPVFVLRMVEGLSVAETAASLGIPAVTVRTRMHRAQKLMRARIEAQIGDQLMRVFDFAGARCDRVVSNVLELLTNR